MASERVEIERRRRELHEQLRALSAQPLMRGSVYERPASENLHTSRHMQRSKLLLLDHSSARAGTSRPRALAVLRLITSSNLVGCSTGKSAGLAP